MKDQTRDLQAITADPASEWIVFSFSMASLLIIVIYVLYEILYPLCNYDWHRKKTMENFLKRYSREDYDQLPQI